MAAPRGATAQRRSPHEEHRHDPWQPLDPAGRRCRRRRSRRRWPCRTCADGTTGRRAICDNKTADQVLGKRRRQPGAGPGDPYPRRGRVPVSRRQASPDEPALHRASDAARPTLRKQHVQTIHRTLCRRRHGRCRPRLGAGRRRQRPRGPDVESRFRPGESRRRRAVQDRQGSVRVAERQREGHLPRAGQGQGQGRQGRRPGRLREHGQGSPERARCARPGEL